METAWVACPWHLFSPFVPFAPRPAVQSRPRQLLLPRSSKDLSVSALPFRLLPFEVDGNLFIVHNFGRAWRRLLLCGGWRSQNLSVWWSAFTEMASFTCFLRVMP